MRFLPVLFLLAFSGCAHKTRLDCFDICHKHGLRFVEVVSGPVGYDAVERKEQVVDACRCE